MRRVLERLIFSLLRRYFVQRRVKVIALDAPAVAGLERWGTIVAFEPWKATIVMDGTRQRSFSANNAEVQRVSITALKFRQSEWRAYL